jgi:hypothetical protein
MNAVGNIVEICNNVSLVYSDILKAAMTIFGHRGFYRLNPNGLRITDGEFLLVKGCCWYIK